MVLSNAAARRLSLQSEADACVDEAAFDALYRRFFPRLVSMCRRRVRDTALAEDIAQETLLRALVHGDQLDDDRPVWPWLKTIATNLIVDHARKQSRIVSGETHEERASEAMPSVEDADLLRQAIGTLPGRQKAAVALRYLNDWDAHEAASFLGVTRPAYEQLLFRARTRLRTEYRKLAGEVFGGAALGSRIIRTWVRRASDRAREVSVHIPALGELTSLSASQLVGGTVALLVTLGGTGAPVTRVVAPVALAARRASAAPAVAAARHAEHATHRSARGQASSTKTSPAATSRSATPGGHDDGAARGPLPRLKDITDDDVKQPEDAHITSIAFSPSYAQDGTLFAAGRGDCPSALCPAVLFASHDGGATWTRLTAESFDSDTVLLPPTFGPSSSRLFAMGRVGLQVSDDGGRTFTPAAPTGAGFVVGAAAISPGFGNGDDSILIGAQTLMRYDDDTRSVSPVASTSGTGPLFPAFAPDYPSDNRIVVGGLGTDADSKRLTSVVHVCTGPVCTTTHVGDDSLPPTIRVAPDFESTNRLIAFTPNRVFASTDGGASFTGLAGVGKDTFVRDVAIGPDGRLFLAAEGAAGGLYVSSNGGSWSRIASLDEDTTNIAMTGDTIVVALGRTGLACSTDGGATWSPRCGLTTGT